MRKLSAYGWKLTLRRCCVPCRPGWLAQEVPPGRQPESERQYRLRHHVGGIPPARRGRSRHGARRFVRRDRDRRQLALLQPRRRGHDRRPGVMLGTYDYVAEHPLFLGRRGVPVLGRVPDRRLPARHLRVQGPAGLHRGAAGRHRRHLLGQRDVHRRHLRPELLRPILGGHSPPSTSTTSSAR